MTIDEMAKMVCKAEPGKDRNALLLALADELESEEGAACLRMLVTRKAGLEPEELSCRYGYEQRYDWNSMFIEDNEDKDRFASTRLPLNLLERVVQHNVQDSYAPPSYRMFNSDTAYYDAWYAILSAINTMKEAIDVTDSAYGS